jgi:hypothetical protein
MAVRFTASGQGYTSLTSLGSTFTITMWINQIADINRICILSANNAGSGFDDISLVSGASGLTLSFKGSSSSIGAFVTTYNAWYKIAMTFSSGSAVFYHADATSALTSDAGSIGTGTGIGFKLSHSDDTGDWFSGRIAAFKVWSAVLTDAEVARELAYYKPQRTLNIARSHPFLTAQTTDYSGLGRTLSGGSGTSTEPGPPIAWSAASHRQLIVPWTAPITAVASPPFRRAPRGALLQF